MDKIYFDNNATTPLDPEVREAMLPYLGERFGNPSSGHRLGEQALAGTDHSSRLRIEALGEQGSPSVTEEWKKGTQHPMTDLYRKGYKVAIIRGTEVSQEYIEPNRPFVVEHTILRAPHDPNVVYSMPYTIPDYDAGYE